MRLRTMPGRNSRACAGTLIPSFDKLMARELQGDNAVARGAHGLVGGTSALRHRRQDGSRWRA
jgi:hypothetical protein